MAIFRKLAKIIFSVNQRIHSSYHFLWIVLKNDDFGLKMKILKIFGIQVIFKLWVFIEQCSNNALLLVQRPSTVFWLAEIAVANVVISTESKTQGHEPSIPESYFPWRWISKKFYGIYHFYLLNGFWIIIQNTCSRALFECSRVHFIKRRARKY